ncbi:aconitate hydratase AcnA [Pollutimonas sp. M17]|uniref:aconitate hydratase AcnA n=1 Tax=Pollutimonas sp. M17 TaxID=2962065 RepID=UPI0021F4E0D1|nr:aconitate hydratase AcnA [Pollutimonas sp. M17]UYO94870.1 aconitate hydratase AcnA [Pollutimonas sp. M17]
MHTTPARYQQQLDIEGNAYRAVDFGSIDQASLARLPTVLLLLLENVLRTTRGEEREQAAAAILGWLDQGRSTAEVPFLPNRVLMHDTTSTPALVDIAAMRDYLAREGADPSVLTPSLPVDVSIDHSLAVEAFGQADAVERNMEHEIRRNAERYRFLRWASSALPTVHINPPGTGIMHTINLEQLATVVATQQKDGDAWIFPDMLLGTDSHTPMINGIGVLGWGVGGLEAQTVMFGMPTMLRIPDVIGVRLVGTRNEVTQATDIALTVTERLRQLGVAGEFVEFHGPGVSTLSAGDRAVIANMAPEYGATTGYFAVDGNTLDYLRMTGRSETHIRQVESYVRQMGLWFDPERRPRCTQAIEIDLGDIGISVAGPRRPQDRRDYSGTARALDEIEHEFAPDAAPGLPRYPVGLAAITSCTNTSDPRLLIAAGLLARKARQQGLKVPGWVKTSLAPGSPAAARYLERAGLLPDLHALGFDIVGYGCTTCIGNSGQLLPAVQQAMELNQARPVAILSGNRNFPGRVHPDLDLGFLMSPALVVAFALHGDARVDLREQAVQVTDDGREIHLKDIWPSEQEVSDALRLSQDPADYASAFRHASHNPLWDHLEAPQGVLFPWNEDSNYLQPPPFAAMRDQSLLGRYTAYPLMIVGDDVTTDHISPASAIPSNSFVADYLADRGEDRRDLNVFAARRGNWKVMLRGAFHSRALKNLLCPSCPVGHTLHSPSGQMRPLHEVADLYRQAGQSTVLIAGERYGTGSSRDWAAKVLRLLGVRAVLALSFERIHRSNLIGMGVVPIRLPHSLSEGSLRLMPGDTVELDLDPETLAPRCAVQVLLRRVDGRTETIAATAAVETMLERDFLRIGGVMPMILDRSVKGAA